MKAKSLLSISDLTAEEMQHIIDRSLVMKSQGSSSALSGKTLALLFEKPSLRTRVSFDVAMYQLGGHCIYLSPAEIGLGSREPARDVARVLSRYVDIIAARTFSHATIETMAAYATVPVVNALSDREHPCQALADILTILQKKKELSGLTLAYIGDGNNVAVSLLLAAIMAGVNFRFASPAGYRIPAGVIGRARSLARKGAKIVAFKQPQAAVKGADIVYTDVWASMGQEAEAEKRRSDFTGYQVNTELMELASRDAILMHPLPAHHGEEIEAGLIDSPWSVVFDQAENRMHVQKAILEELAGKL